MNAEAVLLGTPAIMTFSDPLVVYQWLVNKKYLLWARSTPSLLEQVDLILQNSKIARARSQGIATKLLSSMDDPSKTIRGALKQVMEAKRAL